MSKRVYKVCVPEPPAVYPKGYFPRQFKYESQAKIAAKSAIDAGAPFVRIEYPNGAELDFRPQTEQRK